MGALAGRTAIVTGASTGMGRAISVSLAAEGARISLVARRREPLEQAAAAVRAAGGEALVFPGDVSEDRFAAQAVRDTAERFGRIDILVVSAGTNTFHRNLADISVEDWNAVFSTNVTGAFVFVRNVLPSMKAAGRGRIVAISSGAGLAPTAPAGVAYSSSKHALQSLTASINLEERVHGIMACVIVPGETDTPNLNLRPLPPSAEDRARMLRPEDIADAVLYAVTRPDRVSVEQIVINPAVRRNYQADYERYLARGHTRAPQG